MVRIGFYTLHEIEEKPNTTNQYQKLEKGKTKLNHLRHKIGKRKSANADLTNN